MDLTLQDIPESARLVLLIGSNGSGKSSVFDAFEEISVRPKGISRFGHHSLNYAKSRNGLPDIICRFHDQYADFEQSGDKTKTQHISPYTFYGRTSFRQVPRLKRTRLGDGLNIASDGDRPPSFIDRDERFENDLEHLFGKMLKDSRSRSLTYFCQNPNNYI